MSKKADLHIHTYFSDGTFSPREVVELSKEKGLEAIAVADHDCVDGIALALEAGAELGVEVVPAIELTTEEKDTEIHILGYFIDYKNAEFLEVLKELRNERKKRSLKIIAKLKKLGIDITIEDILGISGPGTVGRLHLAHYLKEKGYIKNIYDAFHKYLGYGKSAYVKRKSFSPQKAIEMIDKLGGVSVLAHPHTIKNEKIIESLIKQGIEGIEAYHSDHPTPVSQYFQKLAKNYDLIITGGSDCHGMRKDKMLLGTVTVPYSVVEKLRKKSLAKK